jgi:hypothetical protein
LAQDHGDDGPVDLSWIARLDRALASSFRMAVRDFREGRTSDPATRWTDLTAGLLDGLRLTLMPTADTDTPHLPFVETHGIRASAYTVARSGMGGGPTVDVLLQIWFHTEKATGGYGVPLIFCVIPHDGPMPDLDWSEMRGACEHLAKATPAGRLVVVGRDGDFGWPGFTGHVLRNPVIALAAQDLAATRRPPLSLRGRQLDAFCHDLASGWIGDPALSGRHPSRLLDDMLAVCHVRQILRIVVQTDGGAEVWRPVPLPF